MQEQVLGGRIRVDVPAREIEYQCVPPPLRFSAANSAAIMSTFNNLSELDLRAVGLEGFRCSASPHRMNACLLVIQACVQRLFLKSEVMQKHISPCTHLGPHLA